MLPEELEAKLTLGEQAQAAAAAAAATGAAAPAGGLAAGAGAPAGAPGATQANLASLWGASAQVCRARCGRSAAQRGVQQA